MNNFEDLDNSYSHLSEKIFQKNPSQDFLDLIRNLFLTINKNSYPIEKLISRDWQRVYLKEVIRTRHSFQKNLRQIEKNQNIVNYQYKFTDDEFIGNTILKIEGTIRELPKELQESARVSLNLLTEAYNLKYIRMEVKITEKALPLLKKLETQLLVEIPNYEKIGQIESQLLKLFVSFEKKSKSTIVEIKTHRCYLESLKKMKED
jgi:hypothetical protein